MLLFDGRKFAEDNPKTYNKLIQKMIMTMRRSVDIDLSNMTLTGISFFGCNRTILLSDSTLINCDLSYVDTYFIYFDDTIISKSMLTIDMLKTIRWGKLSDGLTLELMRRDAEVHPHPELFDEWAAGGDCPYTDYATPDREWHFREQRMLWKPGKPTMTEDEIVRTICNDQGIIIGD